MIKSSADRFKKVILTEIKKSTLSTDKALSHQQSNGALNPIFPEWYRNCPIAQEQHHAMHALTFLYLVIRKTLLGERISRRLIGRIVHHLMDLREFIANPELNNLINRLTSSVQAEYDRSLGVMSRNVQKGLKIAALQVEKRLGKPIVMKLNSLLITCSENTRSAGICMYPWIVAHQEEVLEFGRYYKRDSVFNNLLPVCKPGSHGVLNGKKKCDRNDI